MNFTRDQVALLRRLLEVSTDRMAPDQLSDVERLADVLDAQLDMEDEYADGSLSDDELNEMEQRFQSAMSAF